MTLVNFVFAQEKENGFKKAEFYAAMQASSEDAVNKQLDLLKTADIAGKDAYEGALLMKKAGIVANIGPQNGIRLKTKAIQASNKAYGRPISQYPMKTSKATKKATTTWPMM